MILMVAYFHMKYKNQYGTFYKNTLGQHHREDGPAIERPDGTKKWYKNGKLHREDGPAIEEPNGEKQWFFNGYLHRENNYAIEWANGDKYWYVNGIYIFSSKENLINIFIRHLKILKFIGKMKQFMEENK